MQYIFTNKSIDFDSNLNDDNKINNFLLQNNVTEISKIFEFLNSDKNLLCVTGFIGTGKTEVVDYALNFLCENVIKLDFRCSEATTIDDILLSFFTQLNAYQNEGIIKLSACKEQDFSKKIIFYLSYINNPIVIKINSLQALDVNNLKPILNLLFYISQNSKIKLIIISRVFDTDVIPEFLTYSTVLIKALSKDNFVGLLKENKITASVSQYDTLYKYTRGYYYYTNLIINIVKAKNTTLSDLLTLFTNSYISFDKFIGKEVHNLLPSLATCIFTYIHMFRHSISTKIFQIENLFDLSSINYLKNLLIISEENGLFFVNDFFKIQTEIPMNKTLETKYHKIISLMYDKQLPLKPSERLLSISRQTMHNEKSYHESFYIDFDIKNKNKLNKIDNDDLSDNTLLSNPDNLSEDFENKFNLEDVINKANSKFNEYDYNTAINLYLTVLESLDKSSQENIAVEIYHKLIIAYKKLSSYDNCLEYLSLLEDYYKNTNDVVKSIEIKLEIADVYYHMYNIKKSLAILSEIQNNNDNLPQILLFTIYLKSADIYSSLSNYDLADKNYLNALNSITNDIPDYLLEKLYFQYGLLKDDSGLTNDAIYYYNKCVELQNTSSMYFPSAYFNLGLISKYKNDLSNAIKYFKYALDADTQTNNFEGIYSSALELAKINLKENPKESLLYLKTAKNCSEYLNDTLSIATVGLMLGDFYYACNKYDEALEEYLSIKEKVFSDFSKENIEKIERRINDVKSKIEQKN